MLCFRKFHFTEIFLDLISNILMKINQKINREAQMKFPNLFVKYKHNLIYYLIIYFKTLVI